MDIKSDVMFLFLQLNFTYRKWSAWQGWVGGGGYFQYLQFDYILGIEVIISKSIFLYVFSFFLESFGKYLLFKKLITYVVRSQN